MLDLSIVIVNWNVRDLLRCCLASLAERAPGVAAPSLEVIVVDNGSADGSADMIRTEFPHVQLIANDENRGFTAANNQGLARGRGRYLLLLNPDTEVLGDALATMIGYMDERPQVGALGPQLRYPDGTLQPSRRRFPTLTTALVESTIVQQWWADNRILRRYYMADTAEGTPGDDTIQAVDWLVGACLLVRRQVYEQVGGLDEGFFMYSEELDWCRRIRDAGWEVVYLPTATIVHHEGKSSEQVVAARHIHFQTSKVRYFRKYHGQVVAEVLRLFLLGSYVWQLGLEGTKWLVGHKRPLRAERIVAYRQVLRSGLRRKDRSG
ncbi:MAG: glycosyltransferase family 2 protein [Chloroflexi bacterium]|nr:glycosyltransferase family 2 protein [Chloroflexota bacterium]